jgi:MEMO1 family protein
MPPRIRKVFIGAVIAGWLIVVMACIPCPLVAAETVHESILSGSWYPADAAALREMITGFLKKVPPHEKPGRLVALISPHAGYRYSGQVAAHAYRLLENQKVETIVLVGPSHHHRFEGISVYDRGDFRTPLGNVPLDRETIKALMERNAMIRYVPAAHDKEHSLEIQLPFLQTVLSNNFQLVPLVMGTQDMVTCRHLAETLSVCLKGKSALLVASTDLSHFHSDGEARAMDQRIVSHVQKMDIDGLQADLANGTSEACGGGPMVTVMLTARHLGADVAGILNTATSGDVTGDRTSVVGYMAAALWETSNAAAMTDLPEKPIVPDMTLTAEEKATLHRIAREAIEASLKGTAYLPAGKPTETLSSRCGAFVTLKKKGALRGCIGHIVGHYPLSETISRMAVAAARQDPRFPPVTLMEWPDIEIEISVLTPLKKISDITSIKVGHHGIYLQKGDNSGLLLPQVPTEYGWDRLTFLEQTCRKAGLPRDAWKEPDARIHIFSAQVF